MNYREFVDVYEALSATTKRLEKMEILSQFLKKLAEKGESEWIYLLRGRVFAEHDPREFGFSTQLAIKAIGVSFGISIDKVVERFRKTGDLGNVASAFAEKRTQRSLLSSTLDVKKVFDNLRKLVEIEGKGAVEKKVGLVAELLSAATGREARYLIRTLLGDLRVGVADALLVDALAHAYFADDKEMRTRIEESYDVANDFALVFEKAMGGKKDIGEVAIAPGRAIKAMLAVKVASIEEGFEVCGTPAALEYKYDGFRLLIHKKGKEINLFTRKLENVTKQFPDVVAAVRRNVKGESWILDSEAVGFEPSTGNYLPFEAISQRIKRKYDIEKLIENLPVEVNVFDVLYYEGKSVLQMPFAERRKIIEKIITPEKRVIRPAVQIITGDKKEAERFYQEALKVGEEGIMIKKIDAPYKQGRKVGYMAKLKPVVNDLDLVIVGAEYGTGKRGGWLTSYIVACRDGDAFLEVGMVSSGLKEKEELGTSYDEMTSILKPIIVEEEGRSVKVKPRVVVSVTYQNIQRSPSYSSGYALRFPRITHYRPDRGVKDIATLDDIKKEAH